MADHIARSVVFHAVEGGQTPQDLEALFPPERQLTQKEMIPSAKTALYEQVQIDSGNEKSFVSILEDDNSLLFYFKFPPAYKVKLPRQIGNYNPDWGIARLDHAGVSLLEVRERPSGYMGSDTAGTSAFYIRETKGSEEIADLQWAYEKRKIICATKYFRALGLDYRPIKGNNASWHEPAVGNKTNLYS